MPPPPRCDGYPSSAPRPSFTTCFCRHCKRGSGSVAADVDASEEWQGICGGFAQSFCHFVEEGGNEDLCLLSQIYESSWGDMAQITPRKQTLKHDTLIGNFMKTNATNLRTNKYPPFPSASHNLTRLCLSSNRDRTGRTTTWRGTVPSTATSTRCASTPRSCGCRTCSCTTGRAPSPVAKGRQAAAGREGEPDC